MPRFLVPTVCLSVALLWAGSADAEQVDVPPHRVEFSASPGLPKCNEYDAFYGIITNWITIPSLNPTAERKLVVTIKRLADGGKLVEVSVLDPDGVKVGGESQTYSPIEECFKILYWAAFDSANLLRTTIPPETEYEPEKLTPQPNDAPEKTLPSIEDAPEKPAAAASSNVASSEPVTPAPASTGGAEHSSSLTIGPMMMIGASESPAFGVSLVGMYRFGTLSLMGGARAAYAYRPLEGREIDAFAFSGIAGPCAHARWFSTCAILGLNVIDPIFAGNQDIESVAQVVPGFGFGMNALYDFNRSLGLRASADVMVLSSDVVYLARQSRQTVPIWTGHQFLMSFSVGLEIKP
ncbi:MAG: hypothetical protein IPM54_38605 [Polyangiaceae bacterium]|nr:hypothetical protein [Polyangiaceae bacterium]